MAIKGDGAEEASRYVAGMAANLIDVKNFEEAEWTQVGRAPACPPPPVLPGLQGRTFQGAACLAQRASG